MKLKCVIVEDEPKAMSLLLEYIEQVDFLKLLFYSSDPVDALNYTMNNKVDLIFVDINLPTFSGLELAALLNEQTHVIFTTAYSQYAVQSYEYNAADYLLKPITFTRFLKAVQKIKDNQRSQKSSLQKEDELADNFFVKSGKKIIQLQWSEIQYLEGTQEYVTLVTSVSKIFVYKRMKEFEAISPQDFQRIHNSYIINTRFIERIEDNQVFISKKAIPIGKKYKNLFSEKLNRKLL